MRALICPDTFWAVECSERQAFMLHLFSTFIWATAPYLVSASPFHPATVIGARKLHDCPEAEKFLFTDEDSSDYRPRLPQLKSDKIETIVRELQSTGLGTSEEINRVLIPPLSQFDRLPNEAVADWCKERLIGREERLACSATFRGYVQLFDAIQHREVQDRFAHRAAAIIVGFLLRMSEEPKPLTQWGEIETFETFSETVRGFIENKTVLKAILSQEHILARRWYQPTNDCTDINSLRKFILSRLGFEDLLTRPEF